MHHAMPGTLRGLTVDRAGKPPIPSGLGFMANVFCEYDRIPRTRLCC